MAKAGAVGVAISATLEGFLKWKEYKNGNISKDEYIKEIAKAAGEGGVTATATAGIMIPVSSVLTAAGLAAAPITIPVSILIGAGLNKIVAPIFGRGEYRKILNEAKYYQNIMHMNDDLINALYNTQQQFETFLQDYSMQFREYKQLTSEYESLKSVHKKTNKFIEEQAKQNRQLLYNLNEQIDKI